MKNWIIIFLFLSNSLFAQFDMNEQIQKAYSHILNLEFDIANQIIAAEIKENPKNGLIHLQKNYIDFLTIIISGDQEIYLSKKNNKFNRIKKIKLLDKDSPYYFYIQAEIHLQWAFTHVKFGDYTAGIYEFVKSYRLLLKNQELYPDFLFNKKSLGIINCILGSIPSNYTWLLELAGIEGDIQKGILQIENVLFNSSTALYHTELFFLISFLQSHLINDDLVLQQYLEQIGKDYSKNILLNFAAANLSARLGLNDYCIKVLENKPVSKTSISFSYLDYLLGLAKLYQLNYEEASFWLNKFISQNNDVDYKKSAYHKLAWISYLKGDINKMNKYFFKVKKHGLLTLDVDKKAHKDAEKTFVSHEILLKSRLLYDGGYYTKAFQELENIQPHMFSNRENITEYWYRLARIRSKLNYNDNDVISCYIQSYNLGIKLSSYFSPMSALQIGLIYEEQNDFENAKIYFDKCLEISGFDYERGIHQKAKAGKERINY